MHGYTYHIGKKCRHQHDTYRRSNYSYNHWFLCRFRRYLVRYNTWIWRTAHLYEWFSLPYMIIIKLVFGRFSLTYGMIHCQYLNFLIMSRSAKNLSTSLEIIIKLVYPDKFIHCCQMCILVCIKVYVWNDSLHVRVRSILPLRDSDMDVRQELLSGYHRTIMSRSAKVIFHQRNPPWMCATVP